MIFNTWTFAVFAAVVVCLYGFAVAERWKPHFLIVAGAAFYAWAVPAYLALIAVLGALTYVAARAIVSPNTPQRLRKPVFVVAVLAIVGVLVFFKYTKLIAATVDAVARENVLPIPQVTVPLAISFFTFEFVHVLVDAYLGKLGDLDPLDFSVFTMFFPTLVAGPIKRYQTFAPQVRAGGPFSRAIVVPNLYRIGLGLVKKIVIADSMSVLAQPLITPGPLYGRLDYLLGALAYTAQIYFDFSGYSDIAIGVAGLLGFQIPENFDRPYRARNVAAFWRRWHMSLSSWVRDYIFIPLGGSRRPPPLVLFNLLVAMAIVGLWHGAAWTFVAWGLWHGVGLAVHRLWATQVVPRVAVLRTGGLAIGVLSTATTFAFVAAGWILFAATSFRNAGLVYRALF